MPRGFSIRRLLRLRMKELRGYDRRIQRGKMLSLEDFMSIYCAQCGKPSGDDARFCSNCGRPLTPDGAFYAPQTPGSPRFGTLVRPRIGRKQAGVCQGLANHYGWDVTVVRIVMLLLAIVAFPVGFVLYAIIWMVAPEEAYSLPSTTTSVSQS